jgi:DNA uptake protein ComE-like DNA-binding protein
MRFLFSGLPAGRRITLCHVAPADRVIINSGENSVEPAVWEIIKDDPTILHHLEAKTLLLLVDTGKQMLAGETAKTLDMPTLQVGPAAESLDEIGYVPLVPTADQLTPLPKVGTAKASSIIENTPEGGYTSPEQLLELNGLSIDVSLVEALFEIA